MNHPEATQGALSILRSGEPFQWYVIPLLMVVFDIYFNEIKKHLGEISSKTLIASRSASPMECK